MNVFEDLQARGLVEQSTDLEKVSELLAGKPVTFYVGFDPTADSLHVGHFMQLMIMRRLQKAGHRPIVLLGGGTTMIGDPTGKTDMRKMMTKEIIAQNADCFKEQMSKFVDFSNDKALVVNNADWILNLNYIDFLREVGVYFSVNRMLAAECFKSRMERGLSFLEFNYMLMQSYDFYLLNRDRDCILQLGGNDQWSNIIGGVELIRRKTGKEAYGMTFTLLTNKEGKKMGKTENGAVWLDPAKTTPYEFFQYWRNVDDADVCRFMRMLTELPLEDIAQYESDDAATLNAAKERLAFELTKMIHCEDDANKALDAAKALFSGEGDITHMPATQLSGTELTDGSIEVLELMQLCALTASKGEGRRLVEQGGVTVNGQKVTDIKARVTADELSGDGVIIKKGKKVFHRVFI